MKEFRVVVKASAEDTVKVIANSEEEAVAKVKEAIDTNIDVCAFDVDKVEYVGGYTDEPVISVEGWRELKAV